MFSYPNKRNHILNAFMCLISKCTSIFMVPHLQLSYHRLFISLVSFRIFPIFQKWEYGEQKKGHFLNGSLFRGESMEPRFLQLGSQTPPAVHFFGNSYQVHFITNAQGWSYWYEVTFFPFGMKCHKNEVPGHEVSGTLRNRKKTIMVTFWTGHIFVENLSRLDFNNYDLEMISFHISLSFSH